MDQDRAGALADRFPLLTEGKVHRFSARRFVSTLDTLGFSYPVDSTNWQGGTVQFDDLGGPDEVSRCRQKLPSGGFVAFSSVSDRAWVEASLPKAFDGQNVAGLAVPDALEVARELFDEAQVYGRARQGWRFEDSGTVRVDGVRDFEGVTSQTELLNGLAAVPRMARMKVRRYQDAQRNQAESLRVGPKAWNGQMYDKCAETKGECAPGRLRSEFRLHRDQLTSERAKREGFVMRSLGDVSAEKVERMVRSSFELCAFDREVVGRAAVAEKVFGDNGLSGRVQDRLWTYLTAPGAAGRMDRNTAAKYRRLAADLGVTMAAAEEEMADVFVRLDFDRGTEVCRVA